MARIWLVEMTVYDPRIAGTRVLRVSSGRGFVTGPAETPANTWYEPRVLQPIDIVRSIASPGSTSGATKVSLGDVIIANPDAGLDAWIEYAFDGRAVVIYSGEETAAYPSGFTAEFTGTMDFPDFAVGQITIKLREYQRDMDAAVQVLRYGGTNSLPSGLDGVATDLKGKPIPLLYGRVSNIAPPCVNTSRLIYQVSSKAVQTCSAVYDRGVALSSGGTYTDQNDMETSAPGAGFFKFLNTANGSYFRLGSSPAGVVTADAEQTSTVANETAAQIFSLLITLAGANLGNSGRYTINTGDVAALDALDATVIGTYLDQDTTFMAVFDMIALTVGAWWGVNSAGKFRIKRLVEPAGAPVLTLTESDILPPLQRLTTREDYRGVPVYQCAIRYARNYTVQTTDLAGAVTDARRAVINQEWRDAVAINTAVRTRWLLAADTIEESLYQVEAGAITEATRRQALRGLQRHRFDVVVQYTPANAVVDIGDVIGLSHPRYGLGITGTTTGQLFIVLGVAPDAKSRRITLTLWGASLQVQNKAFEDGELRLYEDGVYALTESG